VITLWALVATFFLLAGVWLFHLIRPSDCDFVIRGWLTATQLDKVEGLLAGGIIAGLVSDHFKRRMGP